MATLKMTITVATLPASIGAGLTARIMSKFEALVGPRIVMAIQSVLGHDAIYSLSPDYAARKPLLKGFKRVAGKSAAQPLIFSGEGIYEAITVHRVGQDLVVEIDPSKGLSDRGFDFAEHWQEITDYMGKGFDQIEDQLDEFLADIIVVEMNL